MLKGLPKKIASQTRSPDVTRHRSACLKQVWGCCLTIFGLLGSSLSPVQGEDRLDRLAGDAVIPFSQSPAPVTQPLAVETIGEGSSHRQQRREAQDQLPLNQLNPEARGTVNQILSSVSLYRRLPTTRIKVDPRVYSFFSENPDVAVSMWRAMQISKVELKQTGPFHFETNTHDGTQGKVTVLYRTPTSQLVYCDGQFQSPALPKSIRAVALMHLQSTIQEQGPGLATVTHTVDLFVSFPSQAVETVAKVVSPVSNRIADRNFEEISLFLEMMQGVMSRQPGWIEQLSLKMEGIAPNKKEGLLKVTALTYVDAQKRALVESGASASIDSIRVPIRTASQPGQPMSAD